MPASQLEGKEHYQKQNDRDTTLRDPTYLETSLSAPDFLDSKNLLDRIDASQVGTEPFDHFNNIHQSIGDKPLTSTRESTFNRTMTALMQDSPLGNIDAHDHFSDRIFLNRENDGKVEENGVSSLKVKSYTDILQESASPSAQEFDSYTALSDELSLRKNSNFDQKRADGVSLHDSLTQRSGESLRDSWMPSSHKDSSGETHFRSLKHSVSLEALNSRLDSPTNKSVYPETLTRVESYSELRTANELTTKGSHSLTNLSSSSSLSTPKANSDLLLRSSVASLRASPQREFGSSQLYSKQGTNSENEVRNSSLGLSERPPTHPGSRPSSQASAQTHNHANSRPSSRTESFRSTTCDQELAQLFEHPRSQSSSAGSFASTPVPAHTSPGMDGQQLPRWSTPSRVNEDHSSDQTVSIANLKKLLAIREAEVNSLTSQLENQKDMNRSLKEELDQRIRRHTSLANVRESFEYKQLQSEKENLAAEVASLREEVLRFKKGNPLSNQGDSSSARITDYSPNHPTVLQRKIADLQSQIHDLHEVIEASNSQLQQMEDKLQRVQDENLKLRASRGQQPDADHKLHSDIQKLREDVSSFKERNLALKNESIQHKSRNLPDFTTDLSSYSTRAVPRLDSAKSDSLASLELLYPSGRKSYGSNPTFTEYEASSRRRPLLSTDGKVELDKRPSTDLQKSATAGRFEKQEKGREFSPSQYNSHSDHQLLLHHHNYQSPSRAPSSDALSSDLFSSERAKENQDTSSKAYWDKYSSPPLSTHKPPYQSAKKNGELNVDKEKPLSYKPYYWRDSKENLYRENADALDRKEKHRHHEHQVFDSELKFEKGSSTVSSRDIFMSLQHKRSLHSGKQDMKYVNGNLDFQRNHYTQSPGERYHYTPQAGDRLGGYESDTATDILISQETKPKARRRKNSLGSDGSASSGSGGEENLDSLMQRHRSKSADTRRALNKMSALQRSESATRPLNYTERSIGFRSVVQPPMVTQHTKGEIISKNASSLINRSLTSLTQGLRPFAPRSPADMRVGDVVKFSRLGGKLTQGVVKYVGHLPGRSESYLGVELDRDDGKHDGVFEGVRYFKCKLNKGVFVAFNKVVMAWAP